MAHIPDFNEFWSFCWNFGISHCNCEGDFKYKKMLFEPVFEIGASYRREESSPLQVNKFLYVN